MTKIQWTDETWNPIRARNKETGGIGHFCVKVNDACNNCYAENMQRRFNNNIRYAVRDRDRVEIYLDEKVLEKPLSWKNPRMIFVCSMTDLYGGWVSDEWLDRIYAIMALCPQHTFQVLTKRPERMREIAQKWQAEDDALARTMSGSNDPAWPLKNVWLGTSVGNQADAQKFIPDVLAINAAVRFVSYEPGLGPLDFRKWLEIDRLHSTPEAGWLRSGFKSEIDWIIVGGESGARARPFDLHWARYVVEQCKAAGVACFVKQMGSNPVDGILGFESMPAEFVDSKGGDMAEWPEELQIREFP